MLETFKKQEREDKPGDEIELDTRLWELVNVTKLSQLVEALLFLGLAGIVLNLNVAIVLEAASGSWLLNRCTLNLSESMRRAQTSGKDS